MRTTKILLAVTAGFVVFVRPISWANSQELRDQVRETLKIAATYYRTKVAAHGGYVYHYSADLTKRWGEGEATADQIWVQPPGTPTVGLAFLKAYQATGDAFYLEAATTAAEALVYGQLRSGGWTNCVDFNPNGNHTANYRNGKGRGKNNSSLDDGQSQSAIKLLIHVDKAHAFKNNTIHEAAMIALDALLKAQFPNGAFPQVWTGPIAPQPNTKANYPDYDWRTEGKIKEYWTMYTLNDDLAGSVSEMLMDAHEIYKDQKYLDALIRLGDFLLIAQMPEPQPAWAQQYNYQMQPIWARKFEPAAISGSESQDALETLITIAEYTKDEKYREPVPRALAYLKKSELPDGQMARYYELKTNRPLFMSRQGDNYSLTYDDSNLPDHYGWKISSRLHAIAKAYESGSSNLGTNSSPPVSEAEIQSIIKLLDEQGRWMSYYSGERLVGQPKFRPKQPYISSALFSENVEKISRYISGK